MRSGGIVAVIAAGLSCLRRRAEARISETVAERGRRGDRLRFSFVGSEKASLFRRWLTRLRDLCGDRLCRHWRLAHEDLSTSAGSAGNLLRHLARLKVAGVPFRLAGVTDRGSARHHRH